MREFIAFINISFAGLIVAGSFGCSRPANTPDRADAQIEPSPVIVADAFSFPLGNGSALTEARDTKDEWFNALDFGDENHLGEDWNKNSGGNTDCDEPVYVAGNGMITFAGDAGSGWGNVLIVTHSLPDGAKIETLYGHLQSILKISGEVKMREQIGTIGNANGRYLCHLHFEMRDETSPMWSQVGPGYATDRTGWLDPSDFLDGKRR